mgnify:CR=1 FL=1
MKRSAALTPLSREHHQALVISKRISDLGNLPDDSLSRYWQQVRDTFAAELHAHFLQEEEGFGDALEGELKQRFLSDHVRLRDLLQQTDQESILLFAECLKAHVRFEERELFGWLEKHHPRLLEEAFISHS